MVKEGKREITHMIVNPKIIPLFNWFFCFMRRLPHCIICSNAGNLYKYFEEKIFNEFN